MVMDLRHEPPMRVAQIIRKRSLTSTLVITIVAHHLASGSSEIMSLTILDENADSHQNDMARCRDNDHYGYARYSLPPARADQFQVLLDSVFTSPVQHHPAHSLSTSKTLRLSIRNSPILFAKKSFPSGPRRYWLHSSLSLSFSSCKSESSRSGMSTTRSSACFTH